MALNSAVRLPLPVELNYSPSQSTLTHSEFTLKRKRLRQITISVSRPLNIRTCRFWHIGRGNKRSIDAKAAYISAPVPDSSFPEGREEKFAEETTNERLSPPINWRTVWLLCWKHKLRLLYSGLALFGATTCTLSMPLLSGRFFEILVGTRSETLWDILSKIGILYALEPIFTIIFVTNMITLWENVMASLRVHIFKRVLIQKMEFFDRYKVGELIGLITSDFGALKDVVHENISRDRGLRAFSELLGTLVILFSLSTQLAPLLVILMLSVSILVATFKRTTIPIFKRHGQELANISDSVAETFSAIRTVRSFGGELRQMSTFAEHVQAYQKSGMKLGWLKAANETLTRIMVYVSLMALYCLGGSKVKAGKLGVGTMTSFIGYTFTLTFSVQGVVNTLGDIRTTLAAVERINSIVGAMDSDESLEYGLKRHSKTMPPTLKQYDEEQPNDTNFSLKAKRFMSGLRSKCNVYELAWAGDVSLEDVYFAYPLRPDVQILNGLSLRLKRGLVTALVGSSGAGKSTIVQLLARFYEPFQGRITIAGEDIRSFDKTEWAQSISIVNQEPVLFSMSIAENIAYALPNEQIAQEDIVAAAKAANVHDFIITLPQGYETLVGERGGLLSGGQRQRIAIARALLKNAPILILDEATSALDAVSERLVQEALERLMKGRTTLVIAHRLSTVQNANQIAVISEGRLAELGSHLELLAQGGLYASLVDTQKLAFE
eukprot:TRINITY_DN4495_c0_g2_i1.p1 TRINITY_DN4495_c0_g2~~TRINITY_DN4495_c0_g2_i1.p1  ORF type:complete len:722 (+),score=86.49 TRINITY_DN4495_c0_g2_i1:98-2263(+)